MKYLLLIITLILSSPSWSETISGDELVTNPSDGLVYKKFTTEPFTGSTTPTSNNPSKGSYENGKMDGLWVTFHDNGLIKSKGNYKDGKLEGLWEWYHLNGQISARTNFKGGIQDGISEYFHDDGSLKRTETYENGVKQ